MNLRDLEGPFQRYNPKRVTNVISENFHLEEIYDIQI